MNDTQRIAGARRRQFARRQDAVIVGMLAVLGVAAAGFLVALQIYAAFSG